MGEAEINKQEKSITIHSVFFFYGAASNQALSDQVARDISDHWNAANGVAIFNGNKYKVSFRIEGLWAPNLQPAEVFENTNPRFNYFRIEEFAQTDISFVDAIGSNTGYFKLANLLNSSTTAAHEYGHTLGLKHPRILDIRGHGVPGIMYPRGTIVDAMYQYYPLAAPHEEGGTMNPFTRKVLQSDIDDLKLQRLSFNPNGFATIGEFSSIWHEQHVR